MSNYCKNCYELIKQLDQLKEENEGLKQRLHQCWKVEYSFVEQIDQLKEKNGELKKQTCGLRPELKHIVDKTCCKYNINAKYYHEKIVEIINNLDKYKQTLADIKEIAKPYNDMSGNCVIVNCFEDMYKILQEIRKVMPDEN